MIHEKGKLIMHIQANYDHILQEGQNLQQHGTDGGNLAGRRLPDLPVAGTEPAAAPDPSD